MNSLTALAALPLTKAEQEQYTETAILDIISGDYNPVICDMYFKIMEEIAKKIRSDIRVKQYVLEEAEKNGKAFTLKGVKIGISSRNTKDYTGCGDQVYLDMLDQLDTLKAQIKARELMIDAKVNPETGEVYKPPRIETNTFLTYKF